MSAAERHDAPMPFWPAAMSRPLALAYTGVSEKQMREWERSGQVRFRAVGPNGAKIAPREQLEDALRRLFTGPAEDMEFPDDGD